MFRCKKCNKEMEYSERTGWYCTHCNECTCGHDGGHWDSNCRIPLHRQIWDRPIGMTD